jgi:hypothetical protein
MSVAAFDTLKLFRRLESAGMPGAQAAGLAEAFAEIMVTELATKSDLRELRAELRTEIGLLRTDMEKMRGELRTEIAASKSDVLRWIVPLMLGQMALSLGILLRVSS